MNPSFTIRPNTQNPDWPTAPDPQDLIRGDLLKKEGRVKDGKAWALAATRHRVAVQARSGSPSDNLDWLRMVAELRTTFRDLDPSGRTYAWIDGFCPEVQAPFRACVQPRYGEWENRFPGLPRSRYVVITITHEKLEE